MGQSRNLQRILLILLIVAVQSCQAPPPPSDKVEETSASPATGAAEGPTVWGNKPFVPPAALFSIRTARSAWSLVDVPEPSDTTPSSGEFRVSEIARYGSEDGPGWLAGIHTAAASERWLAISTFRSCEIVIFSREDQREVSRFGQCGEGPGDFRNHQAMTWKADTLAVADQYGRRLQLFSLAGKFIRAVRIDSSVTPEMASAVSGLWALADTAWVVAVSHAAHGYSGGRVVPRDAGKAFFRIIDAKGAPIGLGRLVEGEGPRTRSFGDDRRIPSCILSSGGTLVGIGFNHWRSQVVVFRLPSGDVDQPVVLNRLTRDYPIGAFQSASLPPRMVSHIPDIACGESLVLLSSRRWTSSGENRLPNEAFLMVVDPVAKRHAVAMIDESNPLLLGKLVAANGASFFFAHGDRFGYPLVVELRIRYLFDKPWSESAVNWDTTSSK